MMSSPPTGAVTFLLTDIEGSTKLAQTQADSKSSAQARHQTILREAIESHLGLIFQIIGDAFCSDIHTGPDALNAVIAAQRVLQSKFNDRESTMIRARIGLHTGAAEVHDGDNHGYLTRARFQRLTSTAHGGQTLVSNAPVALL